MKLKDKVDDWKGGEPFFTFEYFPPKTDQGFANLLGRISRMLELHPIAISVTWGAGGTTKDRSLELARSTQSEYGAETILHLTCTNMQKGTIEDTLREAKQAGIQNILALRGDPPRGSEYWIPTDPRFLHAQDLVEYISRSDEFSGQFSVGVAGYSDGHPDKDVSEEEELEYLKRKVNAGADFIMTQLFYDIDGFLSWISRARSKGIEVPIIPGIMPIQSYSSFLRVTKLCGTRVPPNLLADLDLIKHDDQKVKNYGINLAIKMIQRLRREVDIHGFHFYTLNLEKSVQKVLEGLQWTGESLISAKQNKLIYDNIEQIPKGEGDLVISPHDASLSAMNNLNARPPSDAGSIGKGEINNAATWDEFPNGRFGDFKSPAYGIPTLWDGGLGIKPAEARSQWGRPITVNNLTEIFLAYLHSKIDSTPFSSTPLSPEAQLIMPYLDKLTKRGWWTVGSQPAVDAAPSEDEMVGWGPGGGYIFQKAFVEFFAESDDVQALKERIRKYSCGMITFLASNLHGDYETNMNDDCTNAVTWGVFPGHEIAQSTIIERENFLSWKTEAFSIWLDWAQLYPPDSAEHRLLNYVRSTRWLVSVIHHDYKCPTALWKFLLDD